MDWIHLEFHEKSLLSPVRQPYYNYINLSPPPPPLTGLQSNGFNLNNKVSPSILLIIIILAIIFFISGLLHLLVRFLMRPPNHRSPDDLDSVTALQGQLQQLFHLHDAGVDQSYIDTLPVFSYKSIIGVKKDPFDCAVCLCEFEGEDKLRLLPKCSHAFHMECIDTWLLSHSTCPLCRSSLLNDFSPSHHNCSPIVFVLESGSNESSREIAVPENRETNAVVPRVGSNLSSRCDENGEFRFPVSDPLNKSCEIQPKEVENQRAVTAAPGEKVVQVKLGKYKNLDCVGEGSSNSSSIDSRRCFSMGSFAYVMEENTSLHVPIRTPVRKQSSKKPPLPLTPGHRPAMSECGCCNSRRFFNGMEGFKILEMQNGVNGGISSNVDDSKAIRGGNIRESFSVSKTWVRGKKDRPNSAKVESSRRAFSFRFPLQQQNAGTSDEHKAKNGIFRPSIPESKTGLSQGPGILESCGDNGGGARSASEIGMGRWRRGGSEWEVDSCNSMDSLASTPSFARRTLLWLMGGRQIKVVDSNFSSNV